MTNTPKYIIIHGLGGTSTDPYWDSSEMTIEQLNEAHKNSPNNFTKSETGYRIGYHYLYSKDGKEFVARYEKEEGCHAIGYNDKSIGLCLMGNYDRPLTEPNSYPTIEMRNAFTKRLKTLMVYYNIPLERVLLHRWVSLTAKSCPGKNIPDNFVKNLFIEVPPPMLSLWQKVSLQAEILINKIKEFLSGKKYL